MRALFTFMFTLLACSACMNGGSSIQGSVDSISGDWVVVGNDLGESNIQAHFINDPSIVGRRLSISRNLIYWTPGDNSFAKRCEIDRVAFVSENEINVYCSDGDRFSPDESHSDFYITEQGDLKIYWSNLLILFLRKV